ncbi:MAG: hypothetical protein B7Y96_09450 [Comamonadaceae bacterium 32-67-11]|nr:MAG: hypothetical protein B7Y96_09450 [Comamonadaceae bacterium 32-67-11]
MSPPPSRRRLLRHAVAWPLGATLAAVGLHACAPPAPVRLALLAGLTGAISDLGVGVRDGALLAIEQARAAGRALELLEFDDAQRPEAVPEVVLRIASAQVAAVIGPATSSIAQTWIPLAQEHGLLSVSPTVTSHDFSGLDDLFFRVCASTRLYATHSATFAVQRRGWRRLALIRDDANAVYTRSWADFFLAQARALGAAVIEPVVYRGPLQPQQAHTVVQQALAQQPDALVLVASASDTAMMAWLARRSPQTPALQAAEWASTDQLIVRGGRAVEGMVVSQYFDRESRTPAYLDFLQHFEQRFRRAPGFAEVAAYDAAQVLLQALQQQTAGEALNATLLRVRRFNGLQDPIVFDAYGDHLRPLVMTEIRNGRFSTVAA